MQHEFDKKDDDIVYLHFGVDWVAVTWQTIVAIFVGIFKFFAFLFKLIFMRPESPPSPTDNITQAPAAAMSAPQEAQAVYKGGGFYFGDLGDSAAMVKPSAFDGHVLVVGGVGSGKTSCIAIPTLQSWGNDNNARAFCVDIKGELYEHAGKYKANVKVFNPQMENTYGYDPYYFLDKVFDKSEEAHAIALALIPLTPDIKEPFWTTCAQNMLTGFILHFYHLGHSFVNTLTEIQSKPIMEHIQAIHATTQTAEARLFLNNFVSMDAKTLYSIYSTLSNHITPLVTNRLIRYCLTRPENISPDDLERGADIYFCIPENLLKHWRNLIALNRAVFKPL